MAHVSNNWHDEEDEANVLEILLMEEEQVMDECDMIDMELAEAEWIRHFFRPDTPS